MIVNPNKIYHYMGKITYKINYIYTAERIIYLKFPKEAKVFKNAENKPSSNFDFSLILFRL